ncbi:NADP-dependent oxidoreductase [Mycobacteroides franklinii]|uniref:NADP-dependent oxidoreductase n=1 Tax=Mycobacteroides franklinii TaxID=948102 RepID=UPI000993FC5D|nr:NADP-dependent oxidoreductase [Mycobacteroides franklinii]
MKVIGFQRFGDPEVLQELELPDKDAGPGQIRVKVQFAGVNPSDTLTRSGWSKPVFEALGRVYPDPPYVPGWDFYGVVDQVGLGTDTDLAVGEAVIGLPLDTKGDVGAYGEYVVTAADSVVRAPRNVEPAAAASFLMNAATAYAALHDLALPAAATIAVTGAAGAVGVFVIQLAKRSGLRVIADAKDSDVQRVRAAGADVIVARGDDVAERIRAETPGGVDAVIDCALSAELVIPAIRDGGAIATLRLYRGDSERDIRWVLVHVTEFSTNHEVLEHLRDLLEQGVLTTAVARVLSATPGHAAEAHRLVEAGGLRGRIVLSR